MCLLDPAEKPEKPHSRSGRGRLYETGSSYGEVLLATDRPPAKPGSRTCRNRTKSGRRRHALPPSGGAWCYSVFGLKLRSSSFSFGGRNESRGGVGEYVYGELSNVSTPFPGCDALTHFEAAARSLRIHVDKSNRDRDNEATKIASNKFLIYLHRSRRSDRRRHLGGSATLGRTWLAACA